MTFSGFDSLVQVIEVESPNREKEKWGMFWVTNPAIDLANKRMNPEPLVTKLTEVKRL